MNSIQFLGVIVFVLLSVAFFSLFERKVMASVQERMGPNKVFFNGFLQPMADAMKLVTKVESPPEKSLKLLYFFSPFLSFIISLFIWMVYPMEWEVFIFVYSVVILLIYFSVSVYGPIFTGWFSNSKYSSLGCVRAISQSISYEICLTLAVLSMGVLTGTLTLSKFLTLQEVMWFFVPFFGLMVVMMKTLMAEVSRTPFDLMEGESELVSGFSVEYGGLSYTIIFLCENISLLWACKLMSIMYGGGTLVTSILMIYFMVLLRTSLPRIRYDKLMQSLWSQLLPLFLGVCLVHVLLSL